MHHLPDIAGYCGAALIAAAYLLNQAGRLASTDWRFPATNLAGSLLVSASLLVHFNAPSLAIELFWAIISVYGILRTVRRRARPSGPP